MLASDRQLRKRDVRQMDVTPSFTLQTAFSIEDMRRFAAEAWGHLGASIRREVGANSTSAISTVRSSTCRW
jgi:hypothetical protein